MYIYIWYASMIIYDDNFHILYNVIIHFFNQFRKICLMCTSNNVLTEATRDACELG